LQALAAIAAKQEQILAPAVAQGILDTPLVGLPEYRNTLARMVETAGFADVVSFFKELPPNYQPPPPPPQQPTTDQLLAQVEQLKVQLDAADKLSSQQYDRDKMVLDDQRSRVESALSAWVAVWAAAAQHGTPVPAIDEFQAAVRADPQAAAAVWQALAGQPGPGNQPQATPPPGAQPTPAGMPPPPFGIGAPSASGPAGRPMVPAMPPAGPVASAPNALPPNAAPAGTTLGISPASAIALRQRLLGNSLLATRGALGTP
jgi:hypothetical protein